MKTILVVDDMAVFREPIAASLRLAGYKTLCASDGEEALRIVRSQRPDLILLDISMPNMDGITFLKHLRADAAVAGTRVILLSALSDKNRILEARSLGIRDYMLKSRFGLKDLLARLAGEPSEGTESAATTKPAAARAGKPAKPAASGADVPPDTTRPSPVAAVAQPAQIQTLLTREQFQNRVEGALQSKSLSGVIAQVISVATSPRADMSQLATLIARDPMLSARVVQAANSAKYMSGGSAVTTIPDAIRKVGCSTVRNIAAALGVYDCLPEMNSDGFNPIRCWQHSFAVAQLCERLATAKMPDEAGLAYVVGLCHDLGDMFIRSQFGAELQQVMQVAAQTGRRVEAIHREMLGLTHAQMISAVLKCMSLPDAIRQPIEIFHSPGAARATQPMARILWMAEHYANGAMLASAPTSQVTPLDKAFCVAATDNPNPPTPDAMNLRMEVLGLTAMLARLSRDEEAKLLSPMFPKCNARVWVTRDAGVSEFDAISLALDGMANVAVHPRLPTRDELAEVDALVVLARSLQHQLGTALATLRDARPPRPTLALACEAPQETPAGDGPRWSTAASLAELATFLEQASSTADSPRVAA